MAPGRAPLNAPPKERLADGLRGLREGNPQVRGVVVLAPDDGTLLAGREQSMHQRRAWGPEDCGERLDVRPSILEAMHAPEPRRLGDRGVIEPARSCDGLVSRGCEHAVVANDEDVV